MLFVAQDIFVLAAGIVTVRPNLVIDHTDSPYAAEPLRIQGGVVDITPGLIHQQAETERGCSLNMGVAVVSIIPGRIVETGTTCETYLDGTAVDLTEVLYGTKGKMINNTAPGVFFYYTTFLAPDGFEASFVVDVKQVNDSSFTNFNVQNIEQLRLFNGDCSVPTAILTPISWEDQASVRIEGASPGDVFVFSVKYDTGSVVGEDALNGFADVHYMFNTTISGVMVDQDQDGLYLRKK